MNTADHRQSVEEARGFEAAEEAAIFAAYADALSTCPVCGGPLVPMGALGNRLHARCRDCGADASEVLQ